QSELKPVASNYLPMPRTPTKNKLTRTPTKSMRTFSNHRHNENTLYYRPPRAPSPTMPSSSRSPTTTTPTKNRNYVPSGNTPTASRITQYLMKTPTKKSPSTPTMLHRTPTSARSMLFSSPSSRQQRRNSLALLHNNSGRKLGAELKDVNWTDVEASCENVGLGGGVGGVVSDSPIRDAMYARPAVKLKIRSARKRMVARTLDLAAFTQDEEFF
ncbi:hypothetical protein HK100_010654, partial [Physocladia obscura]